MPRLHTVSVAAVLVLAVTLPGDAGAAPGDLDPSFGGDGIVTTDMGGGLAHALAILPNGKIVVVGDGLARYLPDGSLDPVFDGDGKITTGGGAGVAVQSNGRIVTVTGGNAGNRFSVTRYRRDGSLDPTFGGDGEVETDLGAEARAEDVVIQADGKIVVAGSRLVIDGLAGDFAVVRYNADGSPDSSFGSGGVALTELEGEALGATLQDDGKLVVAGTSGGSGVSYDVALVRYDVDGSLDGTFDTDGIAIADLGNGANDVAFDVAQQADGKLVVAGVVDPQGSAVGGDFLLARFTADGSLDTTGLDPHLDAPFGTNGRVRTDFGGGYDSAHALAIEPGGMIVVAGYASDTPVEDPDDFALARYRLDGSLDATFGTGGKVITDISDDDEIRDVAIQGDGSIVVAGWATVDGTGQFALARFRGLPCCGIGAGIPAP